jgi:hypothetical protein
MLVLVAFWPGYFSKPPSAVDGYTHFHAAIAALWMLLLIAQPLLVLKRRMRLHRLLGRSAWVLAALFVLSALQLAHFRFAAIDGPTFTREAYTLYLPISAVVLFIVAFTLGMFHRRTVELHSRFLACTAILLLDPVLGRVLAFYVIEFPQFWHYQVVTFGTEAAVVLVLTKTLTPNGEPRQTFARFALFYIVILISWFFAPRTQLWLVFADWYRRLPLT